MIVLEFLLIIVLIVFLLVMLSELRDIKNQLRYQSYLLYKHGDTNEEPPL